MTKRLRAGTTKAAVGYCRVSTERQASEGVSLEAQKARLGEWAKSRGRTLRKVHVDAGLSGGRADNRPGLQAALDEACRTGGALVVYSLSRLARSTKDMLAIAERLEGCGADLVSLSEAIDTTTAAGRMVFRMLAVLGEFERDLVSERTKAALAHKRARGEKLGGARPFGWEVVDGRLVALPEEQATLARARELHAEGKTLRQIARVLQSEGRTDRVVHPQTIARWLRPQVAAPAA